MARCAKQLGGLALNVGISCGLPLHKMTAEAWDRDYAVNVRSHMLFAQQALEVMAPGFIDSPMGRDASRRRPDRASRCRSAARAPAGRSPMLRCS